MFLSAYDLPSVEALVRYLRADSGFTVKSTWLENIKAGNYVSWLGLTYNNSAKFYTSANETIKGHLNMVGQGVRSTNTKQATTSPSPPPPLPSVSSKELHIWEGYIKKMYTDYIGISPVRPCSGNQYFIIAYHCNYNCILCVYLYCCGKKHHLAAYNSTMKQLTYKGLYIELQILCNKVSAECKRVIKEEWKTTFQFVPPDSILAGVAPNVPN